MAKNVYEMGGLTELLRVVRVVKNEGEDAGVNIGLSSVGSIGAETSTLSEGRLTTKDIFPGDIAVVLFRAPSMAGVTEIFRKGLKVYPPVTPEHAMEVARLVEGRRTMRTREFVSRGR